MDSTDNGISIVVKDSQYSNIEELILFISLGSTTLRRLVQFPNTPDSISVTESGIITSWNNIQPLKALLPICSSP